MYKRQAKNVRSNLGRLLKKLDQRGEKVVTMSLIILGNKALEYTPLDTSALQNSQDRITRKTKRGWTGVVVYTEAYAAALHERTDWKPKPPGSPGKPTGGWNPAAKPEFLTEAGKEVKSTIDRLVYSEMRI